RKLKDAIQVKRDGISIMPAHMTEQQWLTALEQQKTDEKTQFTDLVKRVTARFIFEHQLKMS
ncbi:MAG: hypothetical protein H7327_05600, partial [Herminiimonas sp.]|nr:hypothetical protein [Herminiimonas sp.]